MIVRPVVIQGTVQNSQNMTAVKHGEDAKPMVDQANIAVSNQKEVQLKSVNVIRKDDVDMGKEKFDAKEKGKNEYYSVKVKKKRKANDSEEGTVAIKSTGSFDVKI
ncbi:MAG: hypothetical protein IJF37_01015 [Lachnospiraceae bacterium]|nr:hypothetical protein [Lachnospiraceae bacterium]